MKDFCDFPSHSPFTISVILFVHLISKMELMNFPVLGGVRRFYDLLMHASALFSIFLLLLLLFLDFRIDINSCYRSRKEVGEKKS